jgi:AcrR family transcriptional regulator
MNVRQKLSVPEKASRTKVSSPSEAGKKPNARDRILNAVLALAKRSGVAHLSLDAIARQAGVSKGGLLYHFPTKIELMRALVRHFVAATEHAIAEAEAGASSPNPAATALIDVYRGKVECQPPVMPGEALQASGSVLAAFAEDPSLLDPVRDHQQRVVETIRKSSASLELSLIAFLVIEGMKAHDLLELGCLKPGERQKVLDAVSELLMEKKR